jgi:hypothetical protein
MLIGGSSSSAPTLPQIQSPICRDYTLRLPEGKQKLLSGAVTYQIAGRSLFDSGPREH